MKQLIHIFLVLFLAGGSKAQPGNCALKSPQVTIHFGTSDNGDPNNHELSNYVRSHGSCPSDGYYAITSYTRACFKDDWHTLPEDHTKGDDGGNMLLINASRYPGEFLRTPVQGLKPSTRYELGLWLINLCKPTKKCPSLLLPDLFISLETPEGKIITKMATGSLPRVPEPHWTQYRAYFTTPASTAGLVLAMGDNIPSGCGNDFALDDITFRECVKQDKQVTTVPKKKSVAKQAIITSPKPSAKPAENSKQPTKKVATAPVKKVQPAIVTKPKTDTVSKTIAAVKPPAKIFPQPPLVLKTRENALVRKIETESGEIKIEVYDNGTIDDDTVSIYHNNILVRSHMRLSQKPISISLTISPSQSHHEIIMVAENLGSIPPNTSVMLITTASKRYELFISSSEQKNARVVLDLKQ